MKKLLALSGALMVTAALIFLIQRNDDWRPGRLRSIGRSVRQAAVEARTSGSNQVVHYRFTRSHRTFFLVPPLIDLSPELRNRLPDGVLHTIESEKMESRAGIFYTDDTRVIDFRRLPPEVRAQFGFERGDEITLFLTVQSGPARQIQLRLAPANELNAVA